MWKFLASLIVAIGEQIFKSFQKPPEQVQKEEDDKVDSNILTRLNNKSDDGFELPASASKDKWGTPHA